MNDIKAELNNRLEKNKQEQDKILNSMNLLPKGHINTLYRNNKGYYYLTYREGKKVRNDYLGPVGKADLNDTIAKLRKREELNKQLEVLKKEEKTLKRLIKKSSI